MSANAINKGGVLGHPYMYECCKFGNCIIRTNNISEACVHGDVTHMWYCCKLEDLILCACLC
jgi:hypothetical protein